MIGIYGLLLIAMGLVVKFCKGKLKVLIAILITLITIYCVIFDIDRNRVFSNRLPLFAISNELKEYEDKSTEIYKGLGYKVIVDKIEENKVTAITMYFGNKVVAGIINDYVEANQQETKSLNEDYRIDFYSRDNMEINEIIRLDEYSIKTFGGDVNVVVEKDMVYFFKDALEKNIVSAEEILDKAKRDAENGKIRSEMLNDGGSIEYYYDDYTILKLNTLNGDKDLIIGKKGEIINEYNSAMFSSKIKSSGYPIELKVDKNSITTKGAKFTIYNNFDEEYIYGADYRVDKKVNNEWKEIETEYPLTWNEIAYILNANGSNEINIDWSIGYGELEMGEYRLAKKVFKSSDTPISKNEVHEIYAEFEINK